MAKLIRHHYCPYLPLVCSMACVGSFLAIAVKRCSECPVNLGNNQQHGSCNCVATDSTSLCAIKPRHRVRYTQRCGEVVNPAITEHGLWKRLVDHWCASVVTHTVKLTMNKPPFMAVQREPLGHGV